MMRAYNWWLILQNEKNASLMKVLVHVCDKQVLYIALLVQRQFMEGVSPSLMNWA